MGDFLSAATSAIARPLSSLAGVRGVAPSPRQLGLESVENLAGFLVDGFVVCLFIALLTVASLHLLRPLMRKVAQSFSLLANAQLPNALMERFGRPPPEGLEATLSAVLVDLYGALPKWMTPEEGEWTAVERWRWLKKDYQSDKVTRWQKRTAFSPLFRLAEARQRGFATGSSYLPDELFMRTIENEVRAVLARPSENPFLFALLTASAPDDATAVVARLDALAVDTPSEVARLSNPQGAGKGTAAGIAAAQNAVAAAAESWLDRFQLSLASQSLLVSRLFALGAGIVLATFAARFVGWRGPSDLLVALGAAAGLLGLLVHDALAAFAPAIRR